MRNTDFTQRLKVSLENLEENAGGAVAETVITPPTGGEEVVQVEDPTELEGELIAADDCADHADAAIDEAEEIEEAAEGLESILNTIHAAGPQGLTASEASWANVAIESYVGKYLPEGTSLTPSTESFGGTTSRIKATASLEANVGEVLKDAWAHVIAMLQKAWNFVKDFVVRIFNAVEALAQRAKALEASAAKLEGAPKATTIAIGGLAGDVTIGGKMPANMEGLYANLDHVLQAVAGMDTLAIKRHEAAKDAINKLGAVDEAGMDEALKTASAEYERVGMPQGFKDQGDGSYATGTFPGEVSYVAERKDGKTRFERKKTPVDQKDAKTATLSPGDIKAVAAKALQFADHVRGLKQSLKVTKDANQASIKSALESHKGLAKSKAKGFIASMAADVASADTITAKMLADGVRSARAGLKIAEKSAAQYKGAAAEGANGKELPHDTSPVVINKAGEPAARP